jgi:hypothetical protein
MRPLTDQDHPYFAIGKPLPFAIYSTDKTLLLAAGRIIPNDFVRESLLRSGKYRSVDELTPAAAPAADAAPASARSNAIATLQADYQHTLARASTGFRLEKGGHALNSRVIGVSDDGHGLIMSSPSSVGAEAPELHEGEVWVFRAFYARSVIRFQGTIKSIAATPFPYFVVTDIVDIDRREVRQWPRTPSCLWASRANEPARVIVDLSVGGARLAVDGHATLQQGQMVSLNAALPTAIGRQSLSVEATVLNSYGHADAKHPQIEFFGVRFEAMAEQQKLALHAFVQEHIAADLDRVWHVFTPH